MKILITGVAGYIGRNLVQELNKFDYTVLGLDKYINKTVETKINKYLIFDISKKDNLDELCKEVDIIVHLAGESSLGKSEKTYKENNELASEKLINSAIKNNINKIIFLSSVKAAKSDPYSISKLNIESMLKVKTNNLETAFTIIRCPVVYGIGMKSNIAKWLWLIKNSNIPALPKSKSILTMIGIEDLSRCILECMQNSKTNNKTYELSDGYLYKINEIEKVAREAFGVTSEILYCPKWILFCGAKLGDFLSLFKIQFQLNSRIYNFLFKNKAACENDFSVDTCYEFNQNFLNEIPTIFVGVRNKK